MSDFKLIFKRIELTDKPLFDRYFNEFRIEGSELTFTNLFVFKDSRPIEFVIYNNHLIISYLNSHNKRIFFQPVGNHPETIIKKILEHDKEAHFDRIERKISEKIDKTFKVHDDKSHYDYVYNISDLALLPGQDYAPKRNFISSFEKNNPKSVIIDKKTIPECIALQEKWCTARNCKEDKSLFSEHTAILSLFSNYEALEVFGVAVVVDGTVEGFAIGERLNNDTFVEHFEKANSEFRGAYQYVLNAFSKNIPPNFVYLNREQDLGIEGMRKAKLSYRPVKMVEKVKISN